MTPDEERRFMLYGPCWRCGHAVDVLCMELDGGGYWMGMCCPNCTPGGFEAPPGRVIDPNEMVIP